MDVVFYPCVTFANSASLPEDYDNLKYSITNWDPNIENWIEVIKDKNTFVSAQKIKSKVIKSVTDFFDPSINELGQALDLSVLHAELSSIEGVKAVRTAYKPTSGAETDRRYFNGLSFANWTSLIIEGKDVGISKGLVELEKFQFPTLADDLESRVKIVSESFGQASIEY